MEIIIEAITNLLNIEFQETIQLTASLKKLIEVFKEADYKESIVGKISCQVRI